MLNNVVLWLDKPIYSTLFVGMPWLPFHIFFWLPGTLVQLLALVDAIPCISD